jgi:hypothetical protein
MLITKSNDNVLLVVYYYVRLFTILVSMLFCNRDITQSFNEDEQELSVGVFDATILIDSFTHIYLVFYSCFIYKMP